MDASSSQVRRSFNTLLAEIKEAVERYPDSLRQAALTRMLSTSRTFGQKLFISYSHPDIPPTNNDHEGVFRDTRRHERLITGHKSTARRTVRDGPFLLPAIQRARRELLSAEELSRVPQKLWRQNLQKIRAGRVRYNRPGQLREDLTALLDRIVKGCRGLSRIRSP
jgi:hypothetical protein